MPERRAHAREQLLHAERLGDVIVGAEIERLHLGGFVAAARQHHDRKVLSSRTDLAQQLESLHIGKAEIENDEVGLVGHQFERGLARSARRWFDSLACPSPMRSSLRIGGSSSTTSTLSGAALMRQCPAARRLCGTGRVMVNTAPGRSDAVRRIDRAAHRLDEAAGDGKPETGAGPNLIALLRRDGTCRNALELLRRNAAALVDDLQLDRVPVLPAFDADVVSGGAYLAALSRRLNSTCSNSTGSSSSIGRSAAISTSTVCCARILLRALQRRADDLAEVVTRRVGLDRARLRAWSCRADWR